MKHQQYMQKNTYKDYILLTIGYIFLVLGIIGLIIPIVPSTVLFIISASCFFKTSERNYKYLINNRWIGKFVHDYVENKEMEWKTKLVSIFFILLSMAITITFIIHNFISIIVIIFLTFLVIIHFLLLKSPKKFNVD